MANFNTHLTFAAAGAGLLGTLGLKAGYVTAPDALLMTAAGTVGGILPDIDLKYSYPSKLLFSLMGILSALLWMYSTQARLSILELWFIGLIIYGLIRHPIWMTFHKVAVHRGSIHSVAAGVLAAFVTSVFCSRVLGKPDFICWLIATALFAGFLLHLILDEIYSVDFMNVRIKRSFGSALKLIDTKNILGSCLILVLAMGSWFYTPSASTFMTELNKRESQQTLYDQLIPNWLNELLGFRQHP